MQGLDCKKDTHAIQLIDKDVCMTDKELHYISLWKLPDNTLVSIDDVNLYAGANGSCEKKFTEKRENRIKIEDTWYQFQKEQ